MKKVLAMMIIIIIISTAEIFRGNFERCDAVFSATINELIVTDATW